MRTTADYEDQLELSYYVRRHCRHLMTPLERRADDAILVRAKAAAAEGKGNPALAEVILKKGGCLHDSEVEVELAQGAEAFRQRLLGRLLADPGVQALINRCPQCCRIVRTPRARQCFWCGCDWHPPKDELTT
jgi:hypothetical protein